MREVWKTVETWPIEIAFRDVDALEVRMPQCCIPVNLLKNYFHKNSFHVI